MAQVYQAWLADEEDDAQEFHGLASAEQAAIALAEVLEDEIGTNERVFVKDGDGNETQWDVGCKTVFTAIEVPF